MDKPLLKFDKDTRVYFINTEPREVNKGRKKGITANHS
jgi:hypothetical protein